MKVKAEESIVRLEAKLADQLGKKSEEIEIQRILYRATENMKKLDLLYLFGTIEQKPLIIGSIFLEKMLLKMRQFEPQN